MKIDLDTDRALLTVEDEAGRRELPLYSPEAFEALNRAWVKVGWQLKYAYGFTWFGRPLIQLPEDVLRIQETIYRVKPTLIIETGVAHGGSLILYASLLKAMGAGRVVGIDIEIRPPNRKAIEEHELASFITLIEGSSTDAGIVAQVKQTIRPEDRVLVILDSDHSKRHVANELEAYAPFVTPGSFIVATDGVMEDLHDVPRGKPEWRDDNPASAAREFAARRKDFVIEQPPFLFAESETRTQATHWPAAYLRRV